MLRKHKEARKCLAKSGKSIQPSGIPIITTIVQVAQWVGLQPLVDLTTTTILAVALAAQRAWAGSPARVLALARRCNDPPNGYTAYSTP